MQAYNAIVEKNGNVKFLSNLNISEQKKAIIIILDDENQNSVKENNIEYLMSESALTDWNRPEEDKAWEYLQ